jgi:dihydrofolate synthase/folylpolyglutamate synthase
VGGTNGKGSVCTLVYRALREAGYRAGLYTSPHLVDIRERFIVNDRPIPGAALARWDAELADTARETGASFFEVNTATAFADFAARGADVAVVEVGLGGRLDATNVLDPLVSCVTRIALDHTEYLGDDVVGIAREKAGIAKRGRPFIVGETEPALVEAMVTVAEGAGAAVTVVPPGDLYDGALGMGGAHQRRNAAVAEAVLKALPPAFRTSRADVERAFATATVPGRFDVRGKWIFDVAHNPDGVRSLVAALQNARPPRPIHALVGILGDKDWPGMLDLLRNAVDHVWVTDPPTAPSDRRWELDEVRKRLGTDSRFHVERDFGHALEQVQVSARTVLITGSFHTVGDAMARLPGFSPLG